MGKEHLRDFGAEKGRWVALTVPARKLGVEHGGEFSPLKESVEDIDCLDTPWGCNASSTGSTADPAAPPEAEQSKGAKPSQCECVFQVVSVNLALF